MKRSILGGLIATLATAVFAAGPALAQQELKMAYALSKDSHYGAGATAFVESLADSNKNFVIEEFPNSALGGEREVIRSEEHTSELQSRGHLVCRLLLEKKKR